MCTIDIVYYSSDIYIMGGCLEDALVHICTTCQYKILCMHDDGYCTLQDTLKGQYAVYEAL